MHPVYKMNSQTVNVPSVDDLTIKYCGEEDRVLHDILSNCCICAPE